MSLIRYYLIIACLLFGLLDLSAQSEVRLDNKDFTELLQSYIGNTGGANHILMIHLLNKKLPSLSKLMDSVIYSDDIPDYERIYMTINTMGDGMTVFQYPPEYYSRLGNHLILIYYDFQGLFRHDRSHKNLKKLDKLLRQEGTYLNLKTWIIRKSASDSLIVQKTLTKVYPFQN